MDVRTRAITALRGGMPDRIPWLIYPGILPRGELDRRLRSLGLGFTTHHMAAGSVRPNVRVTDRTFLENGVALIERTFHTQVGELTEKRRVESGYGSSWAIEHMVKSPADYEVLEFIIRDTTYYPDYDGFLKLERELGGDGLLKGWVHRAPFQRLWIEHTGLERLVVDLHDCPDRVQRVLDAMAEKDDEHWAIVAEAPTEFIWCPDNVSAAVTGPRFFDRYLAPHYERLAAIMHPRGKKIVAHLDGSIRPLLDCVARSAVDVVEAFTPAPMGDVTLAEARAAWKGKVISLNFPSSVHLERPAIVREITLDLLRQATPGAGFVMGVTENIPDGCIAESLTAISVALEEHGCCPLS